MKDYIEQRAIAIGNYISETKTTVRQATKQFGVSKSTVHKDLIDRLPGLDESLYEQVRKVLNINKSERHIRGGLATRRKYLKQHEKNDR